MWGCNSSYHDINTYDSRNLFAATVSHHPLGWRALWMHPSDVEIGVPRVPVSMNTHTHGRKKSWHLIQRDLQISTGGGGADSILQNCSSCELAEGRSWFFMGVAFVREPLVAFYSSKASLKQTRRIHADSTAFVHLCRLTFITHARGRRT